MAAACSGESRSKKHWRTLRACPRIALSTTLRPGAVSPIPVRRPLAPLSLDTTRPRRSIRVSWRDIRDAHFPAGRPQQGHEHAELRLRDAEFALQPSVDLLREQSLRPHPLVPEVPLLQRQRVGLPHTGNASAPELTYQLLGN